MPFSGAVIVGGIAAAGAVGSAAISSDASRSAGNKQADAARMGVDAQTQQYNTSRADQAPFRNTGVLANARLADLLGIQRDPVIDYDKYLADNPDVAAAGMDPADHYQRYGRAEGRAVTYKNVQDQNAPDYGMLLRRFSTADLAADPVYNSGLQFGMDEGIKGVNARAIQAGNYDSGATLKAIARYANDYGTTKAGESYGRFTSDQGNIYNRLAGISGTGQVATAQTQAAGQNSSNNISQLYGAMGNANAAGIVGGANAWGSGIQNLNGLYNNYQNRQMFDKYLNRNAGGSINNNDTINLGNEAGFYS